MNLGELSVDYLIPLVKATRALDRNPEKVLAKFGFTGQQLTEPDQWLSIPRFMRLGEALIDLTDTPALGVIAGKLAGLQGLGLPGMAALTASTLGEAFLTLTRYESLYVRNIRGNMCYAPSGSRRAQVNFYSIAPYNEFNRFVVDTVLMSWVSLCQRLTGKENLVEQVQIEFPAPHYIEEYARNFPCEVLFGQPQNCITLSSEADTTPLLLASVPDHSRLTQLCEKTLQSLEHPLSMSHQTARTIARHLPKSCTLEIIAEQLRLPSWSLRRKLQEEGASFKDILDKTRKDLACLSLQHSPQSLAEIACLCGFSSTEAFQRAFKRWIGKTPGEFRKECTF